MNLLNLIPRFFKMNPTQPSRNQADDSPRAQRADRAELREGDVLFRNGYWLRMQNWSLIPSSAPEPVVFAQEQLDTAIRHHRDTLTIVQALSGLVRSLDKRIRKLEGLPETPFHPGGELESLGGIFGLNKPNKPKHENHSHTSTGRRSSDKSNVEVIELDLNADKNPELQRLIERVLNGEKVSEAEMEKAAEHAAEQMVKAHPMPSGPEPYGFNPDDHPILKPEPELPPIVQRIPLCVSQVVFDMTGGPNEKPVNVQVLLRRDLIDAFRNQGIELREIHNPTHH